MVSKPKGTDTVAGVNHRTPLDGERLGAALAARWARVAVVDEASSTNAELLADTSAPDRSALVAEYQSAGRGRFDRRWESPARSGLTFSALFRPALGRPAVPLLRWGWLPLLAGVALAETVAAVTGLAVSLKWPNDLLAPDGEHKLAGILAQTSDDAVVVGIGLNVSTTAEELPVQTATSLALCGAAAVDRTALLVAVLERLDARVAQWTDFGGDAEASGLAAAYREWCSTLHRQVQVNTPNGQLVGTAVDVDGAGRLIVDTGDDSKALSAGDVRHVR
jgi:BirA family biotin operon repressor/biotin-[acetyl-CoA-carboxylase] ligase